MCSVCSVNVRSLIKPYSGGSSSNMLLFSGKKRSLIFNSTITSADSQNTYDTHKHARTHTHTRTGFLIEFMNFPAECPSPLACVPAGRSVCESVLVPHTHAAHTHTLTAMPQRYSYQKRKASTAAARRMERRGRDSGKTNNTNTSHSHRSKKLAMLSRYGICLLHTARQAG